MNKENKSLISIGTQLSRIGQQLEITNKLLAVSERQKVLELFVRHPEFLIELISKYYPLSAKLIEQYKDKLNWGACNYHLFHGLDHGIGLSSNKVLPWTEELINKYKDHWDWDVLSVNEYLPWTENLIDSYDPHQCDVYYSDEQAPLWIWDFGYGLGLGSNNGVNWTEELVEQFAYNLNWYELIKNNSINLTEELINRIDYDFYLKDLALIECLDWTEELIDRCIAEIREISENTQTREMSFEVTFWSERLTFFTSLSSNPSVPWTEKLINRYKNYWDWKVLSVNEALPWSKNFVFLYGDRLDIKSPLIKPYLENERLWCLNMVTNVGYFKKTRSYSLFRMIEEAIIDKHSLYEDDWEDLSCEYPFDEDLIGEFEDFLVFKRKFYGDEDYTMRCLSYNENISWTEELFERYKDKWDFRGGFYEECAPTLGIAGNKALPWSISFIEKYKYKWSWPVLSMNTSIPWSIELIKKFEDKLVWVDIPYGDKFAYCLSNNRAIPLSFELIKTFSNRWDWEFLVRNELVWDIFKSFIDDDLIIEVLDQVKGKI